MSGDKGNKGGGGGRDLDYQQSGGKKGSTFQTYRDGKAIGVDTELKTKIENQKEEAFKNYHKPPRPKGNIINDRLNAIEQSKFAKWTGKTNRTYFSDKVLEGKNVKRNIGYTKAEFRNLSLEEQNKVFSKYMENRMSGATDAYGNVKTGWQKDATGTFRNMDDGAAVQIKTAEQIAQENEAETKTETEVKITEEEYKKRRGLKGSRSMFGNAGGRGYFDPV